MDKKIIALRYGIGFILLFSSSYLSNFLGQYGFIVSLLGVILLGIIGDVIVIGFPQIIPTAAQMISQASLFNLIPIIWIFLFFDVGNLLSHLPVIKQILIFIPIIGMIFKFLFSDIANIIIKAGVMFVAISTTTTLLTNLMNTEVTLNL